jgi:hypothetical protein
MQYNQEGDAIMARYLYDLKNAETGRLEFAGLRCSQVGEVLEIDTKSISWYADNATPIKGRIIVKIQQPERQKPAKVKGVKPPVHKVKVIKNEDGKTVHVPLKLAREWDEVCLMLNPKARG